MNCSGRQSRPSAKVLSWGQNACTALQRRPICDGAPRSIPWPRGQNKAGPQWGPAKEGCSKLSVSGQSGGDDGHGIGPAKCSILRGPVGIEMLRAAEPPFRQGFVLGTKRLYGAYAPPHLRWGPEVYSMATRPKQSGPRCGGPPRELAVKSQFPARAAVMMAME